MGSGNAGKTLSALFKVILGLVFLVLGAWAIYVWWGDLKIVFKGCIGLLAILAGLVTLLIAKE